MAKYEVYVSPSRSSTGLYFWISPLEQAYRAKVISLSKFKISSLIFFLPPQLAARRCFAAVWLAARLVLPARLAARLILQPFIYCRLYGSILNHFFEDVKAGG